MQFAPKCSPGMRCGEQPRKMVRLCAGFRNRMEACDAHSKHREKVGEHRGQ
jgi:hypothetical protein